METLHEIPPRIGHYLAGFADGEGSFNVSLRKRNDHTLGWQVVVRFSVSQRDKTVLTLFKKHLGCGELYERKDGVWYYTVLNTRAITERVVPFFERFSFLSASKMTNFTVFKKIVDKVVSNNDLTQDNLREVVELREKLNEGRGRKRKYTISDYQKSLTENPQRLHARIRPRKKRQWVDKI